MKMYWYNLLQNRCPKCKKLLSGYKDKVFCNDKTCRFKISSSKMSLLIHKLQSSPNYQKEIVTSNEELLNNL